MSNEKLHSQYTCCTNTDYDITKVPIIIGTNCILCTQKTNKPIAQNVSGESSSTGSKLSQSTLQSPSPPTKQKESDKLPGKPENTFKCTDESLTPPTLQTKSDKPSHPKKQQQTIPNLPTIDNDHLQCITKAINLLERLKILLNIQMTRQHCLLSNKK